MSKQFDRIKETVDRIRRDELKPGTRVNSQTTLRTCPADMNRIMWQAEALEAENAALRARIGRLVAGYLALESVLIHQRTEGATSLGQRVAIEHTLRERTRRKYFQPGDLEPMDAGEVDRG
jgi:hypothetical protein